MNPLLVIVAIPPLVFVSMNLFRRWSCRRKVRTNLMRYSVADQLRQRQSTIVFFHSVFGRSQTLATVVEKMRGEGSDYLGAEPVNEFVSLRSWGGALRLHFISANAPQPISARLCH